MDKKISFVIPVYNVEAYLDQCLGSILEQCGDSCEVVMVDDGSKDGSPAICDRYCAQYPNARVVHIPNGGNSAARNLGVELAQGTYICFVDSDDYIAPGAVAQMLRWIETAPADVCFLRADKVFPDGTRIPLGEGIEGKNLRGKSREEALAYLASCPKYPGGPWAKLLRREFLLKNQIRFPSDRRLCEDLFYTLDVYLAADSFDALDFPYYNYRKNVSGSITNSITPRYYFDKAKFVTYVVERFCDGKQPRDFVGACILSFAAYEYSILIWDSGRLTGEPRQQAEQFLRDYRWVLRYGRSAKTRLVRGFTAVFGLGLTARAMDVYFSH